ncbi:MAG TPA: rRNA (cytidine-2'-O-)-methyltransferase, partial [Roseovarius nubinhibens]|nr:rRNA (cytidine-2'-O-)-methyltransferase [Roseovarius nubinhibens]
MNPRTERLAAGLYLVAVPIGTARDITLRALDILASAEVLVAEDTRSLRHLMEIHGISLGDRPLWAYHDHNGGKMRPRIMAALAEGRSVAYASEAGTPMIADPGFDLVRSARDEGLGVIAAPGPSAVVTALTVAGLPTDRFLFEGFLPNSASQRKTALREIAGVQATLV